MGKLMKRNMNWCIIKVNIIYPAGRVFVKLFYNVIMRLDPPNIIQKRFLAAEYK